MLPDFSAEIRAVSRISRGRSTRALATFAAMEQEHPLVRDVFPELISELITLLDDEGERELSICAWDLRLFGECGCGDDFCQSIRTSDHPPGQPYGAGHRCVPLSPSRGMLVLDVVDHRIVYVEVLERSAIRRQDLKT